ncbi:MAG: family 16 glycosylhydrolase [Planctomycetota bacterium]
MKARTDTSRVDIQPRWTNTASSARVTRMTRWSLVVASLLVGPAFGQSPNLSGWNPVWNDEFAGSSIDYSRWEVADREFSPNNELQYYRPEQVSVGNGRLRITALDEPLGAQPYRSGLIRTWQEHRFGRWEVRADLPRGQGMWPAIWLLPRHADWPVGGEIDIMENIGSDTTFVKGSYHYNWTPGSPITSNNDYIVGTDFAAGMHDYAVEWEPNQIRFYVDDNLYHTVDNPVQPAEVPMSLIINLAVGGDWPGSPNASTQFPQAFDVEYARYWTRDEGQLINPDFDRSGWGLNGWTTFGDEIGNVSAQSEAALDGTHALKLYGQFDGSENFSGAYQGIAIDGGQEVVVDANAFIRSEDSISGTANEVLMKLEYYSSFGAALGSSDFLGEVPLLIADGTTAEDTWMPHQIIDIAPAEAVEARVTFAFRQPGFDGGAVHIDAVSLQAMDFVVTGDFNRDGFYDCLDIDALVGEIAGDTDAPEFDLTGDGSVNGDDLEAWLVEGGAENPELTGGQPFLLGDANLDGQVDGLDFVAWNGDKFTATAAWCSGDFNADGLVDGADFVIWNTNKFTSSDAVQAVPEPEATGLALMVALALASQMRSRVA